MRKQVVLTTVAFGAYGLSRVAFNYAAIHSAGPSFVGQVNALISLVVVILAFIAQPIAATLNRFAPRYLAEGNRSAAGTLLSWSCSVTLLVTTILYIVVTVLVPDVQPLASFSHSEWYPVAAIYVFGYAFYFLFKMAYFGFGRVVSYAYSELTAVAVFCAGLWIAFEAGRPSWFAVTLLVHPATFSAMAIWNLRARYAWTPAGEGWNESFVEYTRYGILWLTGSAAGLAAYHGSILALSTAGVKSGTVGYYALCLSVIAPLNFLPSILSQLMFPRLAANSALGATSANSALIRDVTSVLGVFLVLGLTLLCGLASVILHAVGLPAAPQWIAVFQLLAIGTSISLLSTPSGNFLFADSYAMSSAGIGVLSLGVGGIVWWMSVPRLGAVGAALGYALLMTARGVLNMVVANHHARWQAGIKWRWLVAGGFLSVLCAVAYTPLDGSVRVSLVGFVILSVLLLFGGEIRKAMTSIPLRPAGASGSRVDCP